MSGILTTSRVKNVLKPSSKDSYTNEAVYQNSACSIDWKMVKKSFLLFLRFISILGEYDLSVLSFFMKLHDRFERRVEFG